MKAAFVSTLAFAWVCIFAAPCRSQSMPTTFPAGESPTISFLEANGTVVAWHYRQDWSRAGGDWYRATWADTFVWRPGYSWAAVYGWQPIHLTEDGRWLVLRRYESQTKIVAVYPLLATYKQVSPWAADLNRDGVVDSRDWGIMQPLLGKIGPYSCDFNKDGVVDDADSDLFWSAMR